MLGTDSQSKVPQGSIQDRPSRTGPVYVTSPWPSLPWNRRPRMRGRTAGRPGSRKCGLPDRPARSPSPSAPAVLPSHLLSGAASLLQKKDIGLVPGSVVFMGRPKDGGLLSCGAPATTRCRCSTSWSRSATGSGNSRNSARPPSQADQRDHEGPHDHRDDRHPAHVRRGHLRHELRVQAPDAGAGARTAHGRSYRCLQCMVSTRRTSTRRSRAGRPPRRTRRPRRRRGRGPAAPPCAVPRPLVPRRSTRFRFPRRRSVRPRR